MSGAEGRQRTGALAVVCLAWGLAAATCMLTAWLLGHLSDLGGMIPMGGREIAAMLQASRILAFITVMAAIFSGIFWLAARGSVRKRALGTGEGASAGSRGALAICSRPPWKICTNSRVPCGLTASATRR